jgi:DNA-binding transcriptional ArsR family regulator
METPLAVVALSALAHEGRLTIFRELVQAGPEGLPAGVLGRRVDVASTTLSNSLTVLSHAGLVSARRDGRSIIYTARYERMSDLLGFLLQDCCNGSPQVCAPLAGIVSQAACCDQPSHDKASA